MKFLIHSRDVPFLHADHRIFRRLSTVLRCCLIIDEFLENSFASDFSWQFFQNLFLHDKQLFRIMAYGGRWFRKKLHRNKKQFRQTLHLFIVIVLWCEPHLFCANRFSWWWWKMSIRARREPIEKTVAINDVEENQKWWINNNRVFDGRSSSC